MFEIIATGEDGEYARRALGLGENLRFGRAPRTGWRVAWDERISREHADVVVVDGKLHVRRLETARNSILKDGQSADQMVLSPGETFKVGRTIFKFHGAAITDSDDDPLSEHAFSSEELHSAKFTNPELTAEALSRVGATARLTRTSTELADEVNRIVLQSVEGAQVCGLIARDALGGNASVIGWAQVPNYDGQFQPSRRLIKEAILRHKTMLCVWGGAVSDSMFTLGGNMDWAICTPFSSEACSNWCLYVSGKLTSDSPLTVADERRGDMRMLDAIVSIVGDIQQVQLSKARQTTLSQFFSPAVLETLSNDSDGRSVEPREGEITVLFCDLRGFSRQAEKESHDLLVLLQRVSLALGVMTKGIVSHEGAIADFQGDAALAYWGWPTQPQDGSLPACRAAREIYSEFVRARNEPGHMLSGFRVGIGVAHGRAIAGMIGTREQSKVGVFGDTVNTASRLEGMTKQFKAPILIDESVAKAVRAANDPSLGRVRWLGRVLPAGKTNPLNLYQLLPPAGEGELSDGHVMIFEAAIEEFTAGNWEVACRLFAELTEEDRAGEMALVTMAMTEFEPPPDWDGVISLASK